MKIKVDYNDDSDESAIDGLCDKHGENDADSNDSRLAETGGDDFQWLFKMLATMHYGIRADILKKNFQKMFNFNN